ncbi:MAG: hypothetical protein B5M48_02285 [Candidatus Omnitrophica bacterium 4484_213]|nr:MAG: hypothetical protein B5M48_02285 [Candidatus Omnitrophica bacterium 4484_213]
MPAKNSHLDVALEPGLCNPLKKLAKKEGISLSLVASDLIKEALGLYEDIYWQKEAEKRERTFSHKKALSHQEIWK